MTESVRLYMERRWGRMDYGVLRFFGDGECPYVRFGEFWCASARRELFPFTALTLPG